MKVKLNTTMASLALLPVLFSSCIERYWPDLGDKYDEVLVVDGMITNAPGPYTIQLSHSSPVGNNNKIPYHECTVILTDDNGYSEVLRDIGAGYHRTKQDFQGVAGRKYKLTIHTPNEKVYESDFQELEESVEIDSVYAKLEYRYSPETTYDLVGFQFYVTSKTASKDTNYLFWRLEQTYKFNANYRARYMFDGEMHNVTHPAFNYTCWKTDPVPEIFTYNTSSLSEPLIQDMPLHYVSTETKELSIRYSVLVKQLTLTKGAFNYFNNLQKQVNEKGSLYENQPFQIRGNITNINNSDEPVLGYFIVAGVAEKRMYVDKPTGVHFHYKKTCGLVTEDLMNMLYLMRNEWPVYLTIAYNEEGEGGATALPNRQSRVDCREADGYINKPAFWED